MSQAPANPAPQAVQQLAAAQDGEAQNQPQPAAAAQVPAADQAQDAPQQQPRAQANEIQTLKAEVEALKQSNAAQDVETALTLLRQQITRPPALFDSHATMAALELLIDSCRANGDQRLTRYNTILKQIRSMVGHPSLQNVFLKLVGSKEEVEVSREIQKALKHSHQPQAPLPRDLYWQKGVGLHR
ncbi:uncharacterized protein LOC110243412 [Exaiptasia diaphana]|uniref:Uncharacterized protein n=1 Tax=Exaiptasia diaphana TaxID=2652724 RepID=A0A913XJ07_EXADI|nr:uncharacterized protein LOC110243412 [Exaiptasia diaphana]